MKIFILFLVLSISSLAHAQSRTDDSDLAPANPKRIHSLATVLRPDAVVSEARGQGLLLRVLRKRSGSLYPIEGLPVSLTVGGAIVQGQTLLDGSLLVSCEPGLQVSGRAELKNSHFEITGRGGAYSIAFEAKCGTATTLVFESASDSGQAMGIWSVARSAERRLSEVVRMDFWKRPIRFIWPADGDYYSFGTVNITRGDYWDVVGHELGHAIYDLASVGGFGGGMHKIDECYTERLALSEGWASYFAAWLGVDLSDPDAKFEHMVPRRAPIRFENVPADVCLGHKNEWRVTAFLWDLIDLNRDRESVEESFARVWNALAGSNSGSAVDFALFLQKAGFSPELLDLVWALNFGTKRPLR